MKQWELTEFTGCNKRTLIWNWDTSSLMWALYTSAQSLAPTLGVGSLLLLAVRKNVELGHCGQMHVQRFNFPSSPSLKPLLCFHTTLGGVSELMSRVQALRTEEQTTLLRSQLNFVTSSHCEDPPNGSLSSIHVSSTLRVPIQSAPVGANQGTLHKQVYLQIEPSFSWLLIRQEVDLRHATTNLVGGTRTTPTQLWSYIHVAVG